MEPFYVSINQVNFDKQTLENNIEDSGSFSHVVSYDSEFTNFNKKGQNEINGNDLNPDITFEEGDQTHLTKGFYEQFFPSPPSKTFKAFTETVEALALQQSVIGRSNVRPASAEEVARVVGETRSRLKKGVTFSDEVVCFDDVDAHIDELSLQDSNEGAFYEDVVRTESYVLGRSLDNSYIKEAVDARDSAVHCCQESGKTLIRIPPEQIVTEREQKSKFNWGVNEKALGTRSKTRAASEHKKNETHKRENNFKNEYNKNSAENIVYNSEHLSTNQVINESMDKDCTVVVRLNRTVVHKNEKTNFDEAELLARYENVLKEKAHMEGRLDFLQQENKELFFNRTELKTQIAELTQELKNKTGLERKESLSDCDVEALKSQKKRLEEIILEAHKLISDKDEELQNLVAELEERKNLVSRLEIQATDSKFQIQTHEVTVRDLKSKITELYVEYQTTNQNRILFENEVESLQGELKAALAAKEWYKEQLSLCQKDKSELQTEMTLTRSDMIRQGTTIEKLKAENIRTKLNLNEVEQKLLSEKQALARHLETIEAEMLEREALLMQSNKEYLTLKTCEKREARGDDDYDGYKNREHDEDLIQCKSEISKLKFLLEESMTNLRESQSRCKSLQDSVVAKDRNFEAAEGEMSALKEEIEQLKLNVQVFGNKVSTVEHEKAVLQMDLNSTREEKKVIDDSLAALKQNLKVVEANFHKMKVELVNKSEELDRLKKDLEELNKSDKDINLLKEITNNNFDFLTPSSAGISSESDLHHNNQTTQTPESFQTEKFQLQSSHIELLVEQLKAAEERHGIQLVELQNIDRDLQSARMENENLRQTLKTIHSSRLAVEDSQNLLHENDLLTCSTSSAKDRPGRHAGFVNESVVVVAASEKLNCRAPSESIPSVKSSLTHWRGLDSTEAHVLSDGDSCIEFPGSYTETPLIQAGNNSVICERGTSLLLNGTEKNKLSQITDENAQSSTSCSGQCLSSLKLESELVDVRKKLLVAEKKALVAEEQRNQVLFLEDQLDQLNQNRELDELKYKIETEKMATEMMLLESEVQRLQEEILLYKYNAENSNFRDSSEKFKNILFTSSKKKYYGARLFEHEDFETDVSPVHAQHVADPHAISSQNYEEFCSSMLDSNQMSSQHEVEEEVTERWDNSLTELRSTLNQVTSEKNLLFIEKDQLRQQIEVLLREKNSNNEALNDLLPRVEQLTKENDRLNVELEELRKSSQEEVEHYKNIVLKMQIELHETKITIQSEQNFMMNTFALELEKERGRLLELINSQNTLKEHASKLEENLANKECSANQFGSQAYEDLKEKELELESLRNEVKTLSDHLAKEQNAAKEAQKSMLTEKGNNVKLKLSVEELTVQKNQLIEEVDSLKKSLFQETDRMESLKRSEATLRVEVEKLVADVKIRASDEERLKREVEDFRVRDATLNDQIKTLEWKLSQKTVELTAASERIVLMIDRQQCEVNSLTGSIQRKTSEINTLQTELTMLTRDRSELKARIVQLKQAITDILLQHTHASEKGKLAPSELILNKEEMEKLLIDVVPHSADNKPLSFLQATLSGLRGEINSLQLQVNEHATAVQTSSIAWREFEAQVENLRQICKSSAASRARSDQLEHETDQLVELPENVVSILNSSSTSVTISSISTTNISCTDEVASTRIICTSAKETAS